MKVLDKEQLEAVKSSWYGTINIDLFEEKLKEKGLIKEELEVGKWYKHSSNNIFYCTAINKIGKPLGYGIDGVGRWIKEDMGCINGWGGNGELATNKEVETALIKEAKRRGFKEGVKIKGRDYTTTGDFFFSGGNLFIGMQQFSNICILEDGVWATIIKEEPKKEIVLNGVTYIEKL